MRSARVGPAEIDAALVGGGGPAELERLRRGS